MPYITCNYNHSTIRINYNRYHLIKVERAIVIAQPRITCNYNLGFNTHQLVMLNGLDITADSNEKLEI